MNAELWITAVGALTGAAGGVVAVSKALDAWVERRAKDLTTDQLGEQAIKTVETMSEALALKDVDIATREAERDALRQEVLMWRAKFKGCMDQLNIIRRRGESRR